MDIACPNCAATYRVPDSLLAHGKALRCAACGEAWVPSPPSEPPPGESPARPAADLAAPATPGPVAPEAAIHEPALGQPSTGEPSSGEPSIGEPGLREPAASPASPRPLPLRPPPPTTPPPLISRNSLGSRPGFPLKPPPARLLSLAWLASVTCLLLALAALVFFGDSIAAAWPPFARVTALIGG